MIIDIILLAIIGVLFGITTGLLPGWHPNAMASLLVSFSPVLLTFFSPEAVAVCIVATSITHTFLSFIPSVYLGAPDESSTILSVLPGHQFLLKGSGYEAVYLTVIGGIGVVVMSILALPLIALVLPLVYATVKNYIYLILIGIFLLMVLTEDGIKKIYGLFVFILSGLFGILIFNSQLPTSNVLFPVFTGLFGISTLIISYLSDFQPPKQMIGKIYVSKKTSVKGITKGFLSGLIVAVLPGIGSAQAAVIVHQLTKKKNIKELLISLGAINTVAAMFSLLALYFIGKPRSGVAIAIENIIGTFSVNELLLLIFTILFATGLATLITLKITRYFSNFIERMNYKKLSLSVIFFLVFLVAFLNGVYGLLVLFTSVAIGLLPPLTGIKRTHAMGVLMIPVILWYLGIIF